MNEYPNSIRNNMVNTTPFRNNIVDTTSVRNDDYNIRISSLPDSNCSYKPQRDVDLKTIIIAVAIAAATLGGVVYQGHLQNQIMIENTTVVENVAIPGDATLRITKNPLYSYIETSDGQHVLEYNGMSVHDWARPHVEAAQQSAGKQM